MLFLNFAVGVTLVCFGFWMMCASDEKISYWKSDFHGALSKIVFVLGIFIFLLGFLLLFYGHFLQINLIDKIFS